MKEITLACEAFQKLLEEQLERIRNMNGEKTDFATKKQVTIGVIDGDGIGPSSRRRQPECWKSCWLRKLRPVPSSSSRSRG